MAYDEELAARVRDLVEAEPGVVEKAMFGGLAFLIGGHLAVSASSRGGLLVRVDPGQTDELMGLPGAAPFEMRGRPMDGWLWVDGGAVQGDEDLERWVRRGVEYAGSLPAK